MNLDQYKKLIEDHTKDSYIKLHKSKIKILSGARSPIEAAVFLEELISLTKFHETEWVYRLREEWYREILLTEWSLRIAIEDLRELGFIETKRKKKAIKKPGQEESEVLVVTVYRVVVDKLAEAHMAYLSDKDGWIPPAVKSKRRNVTPSAKEVYSESPEIVTSSAKEVYSAPGAEYSPTQGRRYTPPLYLEELGEELKESSSCDDSPSAHHAASQPQPSVQKDHPEERVWDEQTLPSGQSPIPTGDGASDTHDIKKTPPPTPPSFADERPADFTSGTDPHPAPQTPLPDPPVGSTGHSSPDPLAASLAALNPTILQEMALKKMEADKARRKTYAVRNAIEDGTLRAIHELCPQGYEIVLSALRDFAMKPEKMLEWFRKKPNVPRAINTLKKPEYITLRDAAREKAAGFSEGWQQYPALHFFDLVVNGSKASGPKERPMHMKDEPRYHYQNEIQAAKTYEEILAVITKYDEQGLWPQTPRKIKQDGRWTVMRDEKGALVMATPEEHARDRIAQKEW